MKSSDLRDLRVEYGIVRKENSEIEMSETLKKFRFWLFGRHFLIEIAARTLI